MRKTLLIVFTLWLAALTPALKADTVTLTDGTILSGDVIRYDDNNLMLHEGGDIYTNIEWSWMSQDSLKQLGQDSKIAPLVAPFIEPTQPVHPPRPQEQLQSPEKLEMPAKTSVIGGLFGSSVGLFLVLLIYAANLYAGYEIALCSGRPAAAVVGLSAILPFAGPIIFLSLPSQSASATQAEAPEEAPVEPAPASPPAAAASAPVAGSAPATAASAPVPAAGSTSEPHPEEIHVTAAEWTPAAGVKAAKLQTQSFPRGKFTFNKRFIETKFAVFLKGASVETVLVVATAKDRYVVERIGQAGANDMQLICADREAVVTYGEIQEIQIKPRNA